MLLALDEQLFETRCNCTFSNTEKTALPTHLLRLFHLSALVVQKENASIIQGEVETVERKVRTATFSNVFFL